MKVKHLFGPAALVLALMVATPGAAAPPMAPKSAPMAPEAAPIVTGKQWQESDSNVKKAYLLGMANLLQVEHAYQHHKKAPADAQSLIPRFAKGLQMQTLDSVSQSLDKWYAANPDKLDRPVVETLWYEVVVPGTKMKPAP